MSTGTGFEDFEKELNRLVESFGQRLSELKKSSYVEAQLRDDFLNPFFRALGCQMTFVKVFVKVSKLHEHANVRGHGGFGKGHAPKRRHRHRPTNRSIGV